MALCGRLLLLLGFCWLTQDPVLAQVRHPLPVLWMMPLSSGSGKQNLTADVLPAVRLALQDLEDQPPPLGNYECDPAKALKALFDAMWAGPKHLLLIGGVCPPVTALIARSLPALHLVQVSFAASSPSLSNRKWFGNLFSTMPSDRVLNQAAVKLLQRFRWTRVGVITQEGARLSEMKKDLLRQLLKADVQLVASESFSADACSSLKKLKVLEEPQSEQVLTVSVSVQAYRLNLFGPRYQWIVSGTGPGWRLGWKASGCSANSLLTAADGSIRLQIRLLSRTNTVGVSGRTPQDYQDSYLRHLDQNSELGPLHSFVYDAVWVAARALVQVMEAQKHQQKYNRNVTVGEEATERMLLEVLKGSQENPKETQNHHRPAGVSVEVVFVLQVRLWTLSLGHTVGLTVLFNKAWSLYSLPSFDQKVNQADLLSVSLNHLSTVGGILLWFFLLDVLVLISWQILDPLRWVVLQLSTEVDPADPDILIHPFSEHCSSTNMEMWISTICSYKAPLLVRTKLAIGLMSCNQRSYIQIVSGLLGSLLTSHDPPVQLCVSGVLVLCFLLRVYPSNNTVPEIHKSTKMTKLSQRNTKQLNQDTKQENEIQKDTREQNMENTRQNCLKETQNNQNDQKIGNQQQPSVSAGKHRCARWTHEAQICADIRSSKAEASSPDDINSPEQVGRRLSVQLPILHHSYLPVIGGVSSSSSSKHCSGSDQAVPPSHLLQVSPSLPM
uniref:Receptor ligand binding region domain-containing protein n=1 Tax=Acanthochromis polyacanthus TaxID=80966 RepID=A0A3Q1EE06_9TELE